MRICLIYQGEYPPAERIEKVARTLASAGHEIFLLCNNYGAVSPREERAGGVHVVRVGPALKSRTLSKIVKLPVFLNPLWVLELLRAIRRFRIEALQVVDIPLAPAALAAARLLGLPVIMDMWENYPEALKGWASLDWKVRVFKNPALARAVELWVVPRMDHVFTVVEEQKERLISDGVRPERVSVLTNAVDLELFSGGGLLRDTPLDAERDTYKLLYVGKLEIERGLEDIIRAVARLRDRIPWLRFYVVGSGTHEAALRRLAEHEGVSHMVRFPGWASFGDIQSYVAKSDLCVVPHVYNPFINTTVPNKLFQYMAMSKPVLVSHAKPLARIVRECSCGFVFTSGDPADAAAKIELAYSLRGDAEIGRRGRRAVEARYTWDRVAGTLVQVYGGFQPVPAGRGKAAAAGQ
jgi:glycosyltransferase involved in cell wall biosynthesis